MWMALAFKEIDEETFNLDDWVFVDELDYSIKKSELHRLSVVTA